MKKSCGCRFSTLEILFLLFGKEFREGTYTPQSMGTKMSPRALRGLVLYGLFSCFFMNEFREGARADLERAPTQEVVR
jgi:hypothetical protein